MVDFMAEFGTDEKKEREGVWYDYDGEGTKFLIARLGNPKCQSFISNLKKKGRKLIRSRSLNIEETEEILRKAMAKYVLLDWQGLEETDPENPEGKRPIPYSEEKAYTLLGYKDFFDFILDESQNSENFRTETLEEDAKN